MLGVHSAQSRCNLLASPISISTKVGIGNGPEAAASDGSDGSEWEEGDEK